MQWSRPVRLWRQENEKMSRYHTGKKMRDKRQDWVWGPGLETVGRVPAKWGTAEAALSLLAGRWTGLQGHQVK